MKEVAMSKFARTVGKKAVKATVRHSAHGVISKARRRPLRSGGLLGAGAAIGAALGWFGRGRT
jgi:hypothetical protein